MQALRDVSVVLVPEKGAGKDDLAALRRDILKASGTKAQVVAFDYPERDPALPYIERVARWHDEIARRWQSALTEADRPGPVGLLVWGDPSLYDSTLRIARRLSPAPRLRVVPGITAIQALTAAHVLTLNTLNGPVTITTGRRLRDHGWPQDAETLVVMLDGDCSFQMLPPDTSIWWGRFWVCPNKSWRTVASAMSHSRSSRCGRRHGHSMAGSWTPICCEDKSLNHSNKVSPAFPTKREAEFHKCQTRMSHCDSRNCQLEMELSVSIWNQKGIRHRSAGEPELPPQL